jgi:hypothetical protein
MFVVGYTKQYLIPITPIGESCPEQLGEKHGGGDTIILAHDER